MISKIEMQAMDAVIGIHREMRKANEIDWEQRRYEIAKSMLPVDEAKLKTAISATGYEVKGVTSEPYEKKKGLFSFLHK